jgi:hypothetical protein
VINAARFEKHHSTKGESMNVKAVWLTLIIVALLNVGFARDLLTVVGKPFPKGVPPTCPSDMWCW